MMTTCVDAGATRTSDKGKAAVATAVAAHSLLDDVVRLDAALVVAEMTGSLTVTAVGHMVLALLHTQNEVRNLNVCLGVAVAHGGISVLDHSRVQQAPESRILLTVLRHNSSSLALGEEGSGLDEVDPHDSRNIVGCAGALGARRSSSHSVGGRCISIMPTSQDTLPTVQAGGKRSKEGRLF